MTTMQITAAVRDRLATYLRTELVAAYPTIQVLGSWPTPGQPLPSSHAISVLAPGQPVTRFHEPMVRRVTPGVAPSGAVLYTFGVVTIGLQLDAWATYPAQRDRLALDLEAKLNRHPADTLGLVGGLYDLPCFKRRAGLVLKVPNLFDMVCDFHFAAAPEPIESSQAAQSNEWRATWTGNARTFIATEEQLALITSITTSVVTPGAPPEPSTLT